MDIKIIMVRILGNSRPRRHDGGTSDGLRASLVKEVYLEVTSHSNLILERDFIGAAVVEVSDDLKKIKDRDLIKKRDNE